jgi:hypothetical protein
MMKITYDKVKNDMWEIVKDKEDFVYESANDCDACTNRNDWEYDEEMFDEEPPECTSHFDGDACRYFYADANGGSNYDYPACVVGNWFKYEGFSPEDLGVDTWDGLEGTGVRRIIEQSHLDMDDDAIHFLNNIQTNQDTGLSWGNSFEKSVASAEGITPNRWKVGQSDE